MHMWKLIRPLAIFDIESTGVNPRVDRIIELCVVTIRPDQSRHTSTWRFNPEMPIPPGATTIHGITDADVADAPVFRDRIDAVTAAFEGCDLAGYNLLRFDIPILEEEYKRAGRVFETESRYVVDAQRIFHQKEPRDLTAALAFYCGDEHLDAHGAEGDVLATIRVLEGQFERYPDIPRDVAGLDDYCNPRDPEWADRTGRLKWQNGQIVINFGQKKNTPLKDAIANEPRYIEWILRNNFPPDTRELIEAAREGHWPTPPETAG